MLDTADEPIQTTRGTGSSFPAPAETSQSTRLTQWLLGSHAPGHPTSVEHNLTIRDDLTSVLVTVVDDTRRERGKS